MSIEQAIGLAILFTFTFLSGALTTWFLSTNDKFLRDK